MDIEVKQLSVTFLSPMGAVRVLRDVNLLFHRGKITALLGESGSGKSILGTAIMHLEPKAMTRVYVIEKAEDKGLVR